MSIVVLTGAGISKESGIKTFRDQNGLWENYAIEDVASPDAFRAHPEVVHSFYNARRAQLLSPEVQPNAAHLALADLQKKSKKKVMLITQNVDNLHERAGSPDVLHLHGELLKVRCIETEKVFSTLEQVDETTPCECCQKPGNLRPHIVWFGEVPFHLEEIFLTLAKCELFLAIGTSGLVYPAAGFVKEIPAKARSVEVNFEETVTTPWFKESRLGTASTIVPQLVTEILADELQGAG